MNQSELDELIHVMGASEQSTIGFAFRFSLVEKVAPVFINQITERSNAIPKKKPRAITFDMQLKTALLKVCTCRKSRKNEQPKFLAKIEAQRLRLPPKALRSYLSLSGFFERDYKFCLMVMKWLSIC